MTKKISLHIENLHVFYGPIEALKGVNLHVNEGEIVALLGANGGGKTTLLQAVSGLVKIKEGHISHNGKSIVGLGTEQIVAQHIAHVPEHRQIFGTLSVLDNLHLGAYHHYRKTGKAEKEKDLKLIFELFPILKERQDQLAGTLSGGQQQMLAIARAMMAKPDLLLLDEPTLGLAPIVVGEVLDLIVKLNKTLGKTVLLIEQNVAASLKISNRAYVISNGVIVKEAYSNNLLNDQEIKEAYLGHKIEV
ncbi:ABC transporter ATP-binding protein [Pseudogracilibacillus sp. SO30301A]|uniref:ABC transporter ATP-binding protein n=1 Tax=Pseudogracilibacillus sp. SO30301A TaxID=3098291 RepID=UPI00300DF3B2